MTGREPPAGPCVKRMLGTPAGSEQVVVRCEYLSAESVLEHDPLRHESTLHVCCCEPDTGNHGQFARVGHGES